MPNVGPAELILVLVIALLVLGPKRLPEAAKSLGRGINEFRRGLTDQSGERSASRDPSEAEITQPSGPDAAATDHRPAASAAADPAAAISSVEPDSDVRPR